MRATASVRNEGSEPLVLWSLEPLVVDEDGELTLNGPTVGWSVFTDGFQSWSGTRTWRTDEADRDPPLQILRTSATDPAHRSGNAPGRHHSDLLAGVRGNLTGSGVVVGLLGAARQFGRVLLDVRGGRFRSLVASCDLDGVHLAPGEEVSSETVQIRFGADTTGLLEAQADDLGRSQHGISTRHAVRNTLTRAFMHGRLWANDPDCLMVRDRDTRLDLEEVRTPATVMGLTDGMLVVSDRLRDLAEDRRAVIETAASFTGGEARVLDLFDSGMPEVVLSRRPGEVVVGVCNLTDLPAGRSLDLGRVPDVDGALPDEVTEVWTGVRLPVVNGTIDLGTVPPHGSRVVRRPTTPG